MKKLAASILVILVLSMLSSASAQLPPPAWARSYDLYAGQTILIGSVKVWNDDTTLYVYFDTAEVLLETHVHVGTGVGDIPQTKKNNPIPGQFDSAIYYPDTHLHEFPVPTTETVVIAAHAAMGEPASMTIVSEAGAGTVEVSTTGPDGPYGGAAPPVACWVHGSWPGISGATWISSAYLRETDGTYGSWRRFTRSFDVPGAVVAGATMTVNSDNVEDVAINDGWIGTSEYSTEWIDRVYGVGTVTYMSPYGWKQVMTYPLDVEPGANTLKILMRNYPNGEGTTGEGTPETTTNPTGLTYKLEIDYYLTGETAWGANDAQGTIQFAGKNWATYMNYTVMEQRWDLTGTFDWTYVYPAETGGHYVHEMTINIHNVFGDGNFEGTGYYKVDPSYYWDVVGHVEGDEVDFYIDYLGSNPSYWVDAWGLIAPDGSMSGDAVAPGQTATWFTPPGSATPVWGTPSP